MMYVFVSHTETMLDFNHYQITYDGVGLIEIWSPSQPVASKIVYGSTVLCSFSCVWQPKRLYMTYSCSIFHLNVHQRNDVCCLETAEQNIDIHADTDTVIKFKIFQLNFVGGHKRLRKNVYLMYSYEYFDTISVCLSFVFTSQMALSWLKNFTFLCNRCDHDCYY